MIRRRCCRDLWQRPKLCIEVISLFFIGLLAGIEFGVCARRQRGADPRAGGGPGVRVIKVFDPLTSESGRDALMACFVT
jgi:hypothetical protein